MDNIWHENGKEGRLRKKQEGRKGQENEEWEKKPKISQ